jgi:hypothetical protein
VRAEEDGVMLDFSSNFLLVSPSDPRYGQRIDEKISFFFSFFLGRTSPPTTKAKGSTKKPKGQKKEERGEKEEERSLFLIKRKKTKVLSVLLLSLLSLFLLRTKIHTTN